MECPSPQPGHQVSPRAFNGHKEKCNWPDGLIKARQAKPQTQNASSKYLSKNVLINFIMLGCK
jgi:hypothetical protein